MGRQTEQEVSGKLRFGVAIQQIAEKDYVFLFASHIFYFHRQNKLNLQ